MSRLFVLGCSFSNYAWPTWADMLGLNFNEFENWAYPGLGNRALLERLSELFVTKNLNSQDTIIIQWTSHLRNDWHSTDRRHNTNVGWKTSGSLFNNINSKLYTKEWIRNFWDESSYIMHSLNYINNAQQMLENIDCNWYMTSMGFIEKLNSDYPIDDSVSAENISQKINLWQDIPELKKYKSIIFEKHKNRWIYPVGTYAWNSNTMPYKFKKPNTIQFYVDRHPTVCQHKEYLINKVFPKINTSQILHSKVENWIDTVSECFDNCHSNFNTFCKLVNWQQTYRGF